MIDDINYLLVGNSRLHWAENLQTKYNFFHTQRNNEGRSTRFGGIKQECGIHTEN